MRRTLPLLFLLIGSGCGPPLVPRIPLGTPGYILLPGRVSLPRGTHEKTNCGPEALGAALNFIGIPVSIAEVESAVYLPAIKGSVGPHIVEFARRKGAKAGLSVNGTIPRIQEHIQASSPVMIEVTRGGLYHYFLVVGVSRTDQVLVCAHYGDEQYLLSFEQLEALWHPTAYRMITFSIPPAEELALEALECLKSGRYELAEELAQRAIKMQPEQGQALYVLARIRIEQKRLDESLPLLERAAMATPGEPRVLNDLAHVILAGKGDATRAAKLAGEAVESQSRRLRYFKEELAAAPPGTRARVEEDIEEAAFDLFYFLGTHGQALEATGAAAKSVVAWERSLEWGPADFPDHVAMRHEEIARVLRSLGEAARAEAHLQKALNVAKDPELRKRLAAASKP